MAAVAGGIPDFHLYVTLSQVLKGGGACGTSGCLTRLWRLYIISGWSHAFDCEAFVDYHMLTWTTVHCDKKTGQLL